VKDLAGNDAAVSVSAPTTVDTKNPQTLVSTTETLASDGNTAITYSVSFDEPVLSFDPNNINVVGGAKPQSVILLKDAIDSTKIIGATFDVLVNDNSTADLVVTVIGVKDIAGNDADEVYASVDVDTQNPQTLVSTTEVSASDANNTVTYTVSFNEPVLSFDANNINVVGGAKQPQSVILHKDANDINKIIGATFDVLVNDNSTANLVVTVNGVKDLAGNDAAVSVSAPTTVDTQNPIISLRLETPTEITYGESPVTIVIESTEPILGGIADKDLTPLNGTLGAIHPTEGYNNTRWEVEFTAAPGFEGQGSVSLAAKTDAVGNISVPVSLNLQIDTLHLDASDAVAAVIVSPLGVFSNDSEFTISVKDFTEFTGSQHDDRVNSLTGITVNASKGNDQIVGSAKGLDVIDYSGYVGLSLETKDNKSILSGSGHTGDRVIITIPATSSLIYGNGVSQTVSLTWTAVSMTAASMMASAQAQSATGADKENLDALNRLQQAGVEISVIDGSLVFGWSASGFDISIDALDIDGVIMEEISTNRSGISQYEVDKGDGTDSIVNIEGVIGTAYNDILLGDTLDNILDGKEGDNTITSGGGDDEIYAGSGDNIIDSGDGNDYVYIDGDGDNTITTGTGNDFVEIYGDGDNTIITGTGNDFVEIYGGGNNEIITGTGNDFVQIYGDGVNIITTDTGNDIVKIYGDGNNTINTGTGNDDVYVEGTGDNIITTDTGDDRITINGSGSNVINGVINLADIQAGNAGLDGKDTVTLLGDTSATTVVNMTLSGTASNLVGRRIDGTNDRINFEMGEEDYSGLTWSVSISGSNDPIDGNISQVLTLTGTDAEENQSIVRSITLLWDADEMPDLDLYTLSALTPIWDGTSLSTSVRLQLNSEILDTQEGGALIGNDSVAGDSITLAAQIDGTDDASDAGADVVIAGYGGDRYAVRVQGTPTQAVYSGSSEANLANYQTILDMGSFSGETEQDSILLEGVTDISKVQFSRVDLAGEGENSLHIGFNQNGGDANGDGTSGNFATGHLQIFSQLSEWSPQYHIEKLELVEKTNALDLAAAAKTYFFGKQIASSSDGGVWVQADQSLAVDSTTSNDVQGTLLFGSNKSTDTFAIEGLDATHNADVWVYGADADATGGADTFKIKQTGLLSEGVIDEDGYLIEGQTEVSASTTGNVVTIKFEGATTATTDDVSLKIHFADGGNVDSTFLNRIKWES
jgi:hypothetical protein